MAMKGIKNISTLLIFASLLLFVGCGKINIKEKNNAPQKWFENVYELSEELTSLAVGGGIDVIVDTALAKNTMLLHANTDDFSKLVIKVEDGKMEVSQKRGVIFKEYKLYVPSFDYKVVAVSGGADFEWDCCNVDELAVAASGGADCEIKGRCNTLKVAASGGADVDFEELIAGEVSVVASGGADVELHAVRTISLTASGGADVYVNGTPQISSWSVSGGADVHIEK